MSNGNDTSMHDLLVGGLSQAEIARRLGCRRQAVHQRLVAMGLHDAWQEARLRQLGDERRQRVAATRRGAAAERFLARLPKDWPDAKVDERGRISIDGVPVQVHLPRRSQGEYYQVRIRRPAKLHAVEMPNGSYVFFLPSPPPPRSLPGGEVHYIRTAVGDGPRTDRWPTFDAVKVRWQKVARRTKGLRAGEVS